MRFIPISKPNITLKEYLGVLIALKSGWITHLGPASDKMRDILRKYAKKTWNIQDIDVALTSNGTTALHLALLAAGVSDGDEVIVPNLCYAAVANSVLYCHARPIVADISPEDWNLDLLKAEKLINERTKAIVLVDNYGRNFEMAGKRPRFLNGIKVIRDISESFPDILEHECEDFDFATMSFFANKIITTGEGGAIFASKSDIAKIRILKSQGVRKRGTYSHEILGYNYRITNLAAALFLSQWQRRKRLLDKRRKIFDIYKQQLSELNIAYTSNNEFHTAPWLFTIRLLDCDEKLISKIKESMEKNKIEIRESFIPISSLPYLRDKISHENNLEISLEYARNIISLPTFIGLKKKQIKKICGVIKTELQK